VVAEILDEDGYLADFTRREDGAFIITEHNCAVLGVALRYRHACSSELDFLKAALPNAEVTRIAHRINGGHVCAYLVEGESLRSGGGGEVTDRETEDGGWRMESQ
jgi:predicted ArsR family transcriptional regulator